MKPDNDSLGRCVEILSEIYNSEITLKHDDAFYKRGRELFEMMSKMYSEHLDRCVEMCRDRQESFNIIHTIGLYTGPSKKLKDKVDEGSITICAGMGARAISLELARLALKGHDDELRQRTG